MDNFCPVCLSKGIKNRIELIQINLDEALLMCKADKCMWPFGYEDFTFVQRVAGKTWSCYWDNYKRNIPVPIESAPTNAVGSVPALGTIISSREKLSTQSVTNTNVFLPSSSSIARAQGSDSSNVYCNDSYSTESVSSISSNNLKNTIETSPSASYPAPSKDVSIVKQNIVIQPTRNIHATKSNTVTGKRYEKFSFKALRKEVSDSTPTNANNVPNSTISPESNNDNKDNGNSRLGANDGSNNSTTNSNRNGDGALLSTINCQVDIIVPDIPAAKSETGGKLSALDNINENMSVNIDSILNEYFSADCVSSKDTCDDWLDDLLSSAI